MALTPFGKFPIKPATRAATTANIADLAAGAPDTLDGVSLAAGDRILVKDQSTGSQNGIYVVDVLGTGADGQWSRSEDSDQDAEVKSGELTAVTEGAQAGLFQLTTADPITVGSTSISYSEVGAGDVTKVGTPADNQIGVWTGNGTIEGDVNLTWTGSVLSVNGAAVFNEAGADVDFRIESSGDANMFFVDAGNNRVGIGTNAPVDEFSVQVSQDGVTAVHAQNINGGTSAEAMVYVDTGSSHFGYLTISGAGFSTNGLRVADQLHLATSGLVAGGILYSDNNASGRHIFSVGGVATTAERLRISGPEVVVNNAGEDADFRVEGDTRANLLLVDAGTDRVGVNRAAGTHGATLDVDNLAVAESVLILRDNGTAVFTVADGGAITAEGGAVFNEAGADVDFRVESSGDANMFFVDAGNNRVGVGTNAPTEEFSVEVSQNGVTAIHSQNTNAGTAAEAMVYVDIGSSHFGYLTMSGTGFTTNGLRVADQLHLATSGLVTGGILYTDSHSSGRHIFTVGGLAATNERFRIGTSEVVVNDNGEDADFRVEGDTDAELLFVDASTDRVAVGYTDPAVKLDVDGAIRGQVEVEAAASDPAPAARESRKVFTNEGAVAQVTMTLPSAVAGLELTFIVQDADGIQITAATGDTIRQATSVSSAGGTASSTTIGDTIRLVAINATEWVAVASHGTWTLA